MSVSKRPKKILIVEDEKPMAQVLELKLTHSGFETKVVFDGEAALKVLKKEKFDLIILDLVLPKMNGFAVLAQLKKRKIKTPVIVASNLGQKEDIERARKLGVRDYFVKADVSIAKVVDHVKKALKI